MKKKFLPKQIEKKWQKEWESKNIYSAKDFSKKKKYYTLVEFPYPSGDGLHTGHVRGYTAMDIIARKRRMEGYNVLYPIGWDAFGLPTENYAIQKGIHPSVVTKKNTDTFRRQLKALGFSFDWKREVNTTDPEYYKWTQWIFLQLYTHGLAYKKKMYINWCPKDKIGLANEEVVDGACERCGTKVEQKEKEQWLLRITAYADKLLAGLDTVDYIEAAKTQQKNWIGRSEGALVKFPIVTAQKKPLMDGVEVFTTRVDTIFGCTYLVVNPEHPILATHRAYIQNWDEIEAYSIQAKKKSELQRIDTSKEKTGVLIQGIHAHNLANKKEIPIFVSDYVLATYGTGAIMAVPAHDERDFQFAKKFNLPIVSVVSKDAQSRLDKEEMYTGEGFIINSGTFTGMTSKHAKSAIAKFVHGKSQTQYHLRDWVFSRQHYWGEPIPLVFCNACAERIQKGTHTENEFSKGELLNPGWIALSHKDVPVTLPRVRKYEPTHTGESPLAGIKKWVHTTCPKCGAPAFRETDTMPNWAGSSWYFLRYSDPKNKKACADYKKMKYWMSVDWYNGGMEHTTLHLLYSRFWNIFLHDIGVVPVSEPYKKRTSHGMILGEGGIKMSKSRGNVVNPDSVVQIYGADALRVYEMFMGPFTQSIAWDAGSIAGCSRFLNKVWDISTQKIVSRGTPTDTLLLQLHTTIKKVSEDIETMSFNTAISSLMIFINTCYGLDQIPQKVWEQFLRILAPFAPFITEELWSQLGHTKSIHTEPWPSFEKKYLQSTVTSLVCQVNGKKRAVIEIPTGTEKEAAMKIALQNDSFCKYVQGKEVLRSIFVPDKIINIIVKE
ncbi:MAG: leucine--tRNA ligase [Candidatus Paceibacterota bacterium]